MALNVVNRHASMVEDNIAGTGAFTTASFTPRNSCILLARIGATETTNGGLTGSSITITDSAGLSWTQAVVSTTSPAWSYGTRVWWAPVTTGVPMTISADAGARNIQIYRVEVFDITGADAAPIGATAVGSDADGNGAASITLSGAPATDSIVFAFAMNNMDSGNNVVTPGADFTEIYDVFAAGWSSFHAQSRTASTSTTVAWVDLSTAGTPSGACLVAVEIKVSGGGAAVSTTGVSDLVQQRIMTGFAA